MFLRAGCQLISLAQIVIFEGAVDWKAGLNIGKVCSVFPYLQLYIPVHMILLCVSFFFEMFNAVSFSRSLWLIQTHLLLLVLWRSKNGISSGNVSVSERRILPHIAWGEVSLLDSDTVFDLGFPAKRTMCPSQQFSEGHFVFFWGGGGGHYIFLIILTDRVLMWSNGMIKSELNIQLLSGGKVFNKFIHVRLIWDFQFWQSKQNILFGGSNFSHLYFSGQLCWKFRFGNVDFGLLNKLIILRLSFNICQDRDSQLCTWIFKLVLGNVGNLSLLCMSFSGFWFLLYF